MKEDIPMVKKQMKRRSVTLDMREMRIKPTVRQHFTPSRTAIIKKTIRSVGENAEKLDEPSCLAGGHVKWCSHVGKQFGSSSKSYI